MTTDDEYLKRLIHHVSVLIAWEAGAQGTTHNQLMLAVAFLQAHLAQVVHERRRVTE